MKSSTESRCWPKYCASCRELLVPLLQGEATHPSLGLTHLARRPPWGYWRTALFSATVIYENSVKLTWVAWGHESYGWLHFIIRVGGIWGLKGENMEVIRDGLRARRQRNVRHNGKRRWFVVEHWQVFIPCTSDIRAWSHTCIYLLFWCRWVSILNLASKGTRLADFAR